MTDHAPSHQASLKERALEELKVFWLIAIYLWVFLGAFAAYRVLVLAEDGTLYVHFGVALVESLIIAKVVLIGRMFSFSRRYEDRALIVSVLYKTLLFGVLVMLFGLLEHMVVGWFHGKGLFGGLKEIEALGGYELASRVVTLMVAFLPFFAFWELGRVIGMGKLASIFFKKPESAST